MFENYPKQRPPLPDAIRAIYSDLYKRNREGQTAASSVAQKMESWFHRQVAADVADPRSAEKATLELGAGTLNQLRYEPDVRTYDIVEPFTELFEGSADLPRIRNTYADISEVPAGSRYDRITSVAVLEHICNLPEVVARSGLLMADGGVFRAGIPSEGTWLWTLGWKLTTGLEFRLKHGLDYGELIRHEHVNTAEEIEEVLDYVFDDVRCRVFGLARSISFYQYFECRKPDRERCRELVLAAGRNP